MARQIEHAGSTGFSGVARVPASALAGLALATLLPSMSTSSANVALPTLARVFDAPFEEVQWVVLANLLALTTLVVSVGRLGDLYGRRGVLLIGIFIFAAASAISATAPSLWVLIAARAAQGIGAAAMMALPMSLISSTLTKDKVGAALGILGTMSAVGTALGPSLGGFLISAFGWQAIFLVNVPVAALVWVCVAKTIPADTISDERAPFDARGTAMLAFALVTYALGVTVTPQSFSSLNIALLASAAVGAWAFVRMQSVTAFPLVQTSLFKQPVISASFVMSAIITAIVMATLVVGPFYLVGGLHLDASQIGMVMSAGPIVAALSGAPAGRLVDQVGPSPVTIGGIACVTLGAAAIVIMAPMFGIADYIASLVLITSGYAFFQAANNTGVMTSVPQEQRGVVSGLLNLSRNLGLITGTAVMGAIFTQASGSLGTAHADASAVTTGMQITFASAAAASFGALVLAFRIRTLQRGVGL